MGLMPLEYKDCLTDSPYFRKILQSHEKELDKTSSTIKSLIKDINNLLNAAKSLSRAQRALVARLKGFTFENIGGCQTDDENVITNSLREFAQILEMVDDELERMLDHSCDRIIEPLESFRKDAIGGAKEGRKKFEKQTSKFYQSQERYLNLSTKKDGQVLQEADASLEMEQRHFIQASLEYVFLLQELQERKKFEFVEILLSHTYSWLTFYHQGHEVYKDCSPYMTNLQERLQRTRENFNSTRQEAVLLKNKMLEIGDPGGMDKVYTRQGYLFLMEKKAFGTTWTKHYCQFQKDNKLFNMIPYNQIQQKFTSSETVRLKSCIRRASDSIDKRFCFDIMSQTQEKGERQSQTFTLQALSEEDCKHWMDAMDGKEPVYATPGGTPGSKETTTLDDAGLNFITRAISLLESRGLEDQGLYRLVGVSSKVSKLLALGLDASKAEKLVLDDSYEWEVKTITSAIKQYFRNLPEPLMTYKLHSDFITSAKNEKLFQRVNDIHCLVHRLPKTNFKVLKTLMQHLCNVSQKCNKNLMTVSNLGVCFGPTLLRPEEESVAAIMDIKFCNIVVEILIEHFDKIFNSSPSPLELGTSGDGSFVKGESSSSTSSFVSCSPKSSPPLPLNPQPHSHLAHVNNPKNSQPVLQTVVTSFTTSEPQTAVHFGNQMIPTQTTSHIGNLLRSDATSNLKNNSIVNHSLVTNQILSQASHHYQNNQIGSANYNQSRIPPPPASNHVWAHSTSTQSLNSGLNSHSSLTSLTSGPASLYDHSNNHMSLATNNNHIRPGRPPPPINGRTGATHLSFVNPLAGDRVEGPVSSSSSCESLSSRSSRDQCPPPPSISSPQPKKRDGISSREQLAKGPKISDAGQKGMRLGTAYPPTYRQHMETISLSGSQSSSALPSLASACASSASSVLKGEIKDTGRRVRTLYACVGENESELSFEPNQILTNVRSSKEPGWLEGSLNGRSGLVPENYVEYIDQKGSLPTLISQRNTDV